MSHNRRICGHALEGTTHIYRPDMPPYDPEANDCTLDYEPGTLILGNGMTVKIVAVFMDWNGIEGLDMLYVSVPATGHVTHVVPAHLLLGPLTDAGNLPLPEVPC